MAAFFFPDPSFSRKALETGAFFFVDCRPCPTIRQEVHPLDFAALLADAKGEKSLFTHYIPPVPGRPESYFTEYLRADGTVFFAGTVYMSKLTS